MREARRVWIAKRQPFMVGHLERLAFIDETSLKTNMVKTTGWAPRGARLVDHTPFGHSLPGSACLHAREGARTDVYRSTPL